MVPKKTGFRFCRKKGWSRKIILHGIRRIMAMEIRGGGFVSPAFLESTRYQSDGKTLNQEELSMDVGGSTYTR